MQLSDLDSISNFLKIIFYFLIIVLGIIVFYNFNWNIKEAVLHILSPNITSVQN